MQKHDFIAQDSQFLADGRKPFAKNLSDLTEGGSRFVLAKS
jgi:hypothetical protein